MLVFQDVRIGCALRDAGRITPLPVLPARLTHDGGFVRKTKYAGDPF